MPLIAPDDIVRVTVEGSLFVAQEGGGGGYSEIWSNSWHVWNDNPIFANHAPAIAQDIMGIYSTSQLSGLLTDSVITTRAIWAPWDGTKFTGTAIYPYAGSPGATNPTLPPQCATVLSLLCVDDYPVSARRIRGRIFYPPVGVTGVLQDGRLLDTRTAELALEVVGIGERIEAELEGSRLMVWSDKLQMGSVVQDVSVGNVVDTMRSRRNQAGEFRSTEEMTDF